MQTYTKQILNLNSPSFQQIRKIAGESISNLSQYERDILWEELDHGVSLLDSHEQMCQYMTSYGNMHQAKLLDAFKKLPYEIFTRPFEVVDWGCGQAMGTINLFDFLKERNLQTNIKKITLVEPSKTALERGLLHTSVYISNSVTVKSLNDYFENIRPEQINSENNLPQIQIGRASCRERV